MVHLSAPGWNVIGGGEPEIPGISIGHNEYGAWGLTVFRTDAEDLYVYKLNPEDPDQYWFNGAWKNMKLEPDTILVKNESQVPVLHKYTVHGPVVLQDPKENIGYAVRCGWLEVGGSPYLASLRMNQSIDFESFRDACNYFHIPGENMVWADRNGQIGWQAVGIAPVRHGFSGLVPIPGDGTHEWTDYLEIKRKPHLINPESGIIITANENVTALDYAFPEAIGFSWSDRFRGDRIAEVLGKGTKNTMVDMVNLQTDYLSIIARTLIPLLKPVEIKEKSTAQAKELLLHWDQYMESSSVEATIYHRWETELSNRLKDMKIPEEARPYVNNIQPGRWIQWLLAPDGDFGEDPLVGRDKILSDALTSAISFLIGELGDDWENWTYGQLKYKHVQMEHALGNIVPDTLADRLNTKVEPRGGYGYCVGSTGGHLNQSSGATFRIIVDTGDWDKTLATNAPGQSGDPSNKHYKDLFESWSKDQYFPLFFSRKKINSVADDTYYLVPED
jgi:penicillin amidase